MRKLTILFSLLTLSVGLWAETVEYLDPVYNDLTDVTKGIKEWKNATADAIVVQSTSAPFTFGNNWYVVVGEDVKFDGGAVCNREVKLILADGAKLTVTGDGQNAGVKVSGEGNSLTIYAQSTDPDQMGQLIANGGVYSSGIGGGTNSSCSNITINGGKITATGGVNGAGIGGGNTGNGSNIIINDGIVASTGGANAAGIGGGGNKGNGSNITINGGTITTNGGDSGAGIGGGRLGDGSNITINGDIVAATGGSGASGIGGGYEGKGTNITIQGGTITANGGRSGAGIGGIGSYASKIYVATDLVIKADNNNPPTTVIAANRFATTDISSRLAGKRYATVEEGSDPTALPTLFGDDVKGNKFLHNGHLIIRKGGKTYNAIGVVR